MDVWIPPLSKHASIPYGFLTSAIFFLSCLSRLTSGTAAAQQAEFSQVARSRSAMSTSSESPERKEGDEWTMVHRVSEVCVPCRRYGARVCFCLKSFELWDFATVQHNKQHRKTTQVVPVCLSCSTLPSPPRPELNAPLHARLRSSCLVKEVAKKPYTFHMTQPPFVFSTSAALQAGPFSRFRKRRNPHSSRTFSK